jgi:hypothetical protein
MGISAVNLETALSPKAERIRMMRYAETAHVSAEPKTIQVIRPGLHHLATLIDALRPVVGRAHFVRS